MNQKLLDIQLNLLLAIESIKQHQSRNILTGFGVAWGVMILILLVGAGQGLQDGVMRIFGNYAQNSLWFYAGMADSESVNKRPILFDSRLIDDIYTAFPDITVISPQKSTSALVVNSNGNSSNYTISGVGAQYFSIKLLTINHGRLFNPWDEKQNRKVAIIGSRAAEEIFGNTNALGQYIKITDTWFMITGVLKKGSLFDQAEQKKIFIPISTMCQTIDYEDKFTEFGIVTTSECTAASYEKSINSYLARRYNYVPEDTKAMYVFNRKEQVKSFNSLFGTIKVFLWAIGLSLLLTGMLGICNTMIIVVKERAKEIGIRKALGAKSSQVLSMILTESVLITLIAGIIGMLLGMFISFLINITLFDSTDADSSIVQGVVVNISLAMGAIITLVISGSLAGLYPARKAADITPVEAINHESN